MRDKVPPYIWNEMMLCYLRQILSKLSFDIVTERQTSTRNNVDNSFRVLCCDVGDVLMFSEWMSQGFSHVNANPVLFYDCRAATLMLFFSSALFRILFILICHFYVFHVKVLTTQAWSIRHKMFVFLDKLHSKCTDQVRLSASSLRMQTTAYEV